MKTAFTVIAMFFILGGLLWVFIGIDKDSDELEDEEK